MQCVLCSSFYSFCAAANPEYNIVTWCNVCTCFPAGPWIILAICNVILYVFVWFCFSDLFHFFNRNDILFLTSLRQIFLNADRRELRRIPGGLWTLGHGFAWIRKNAWQKLLSCLWAIDFMKYQNSEWGMVLRCFFLKNKGVPGPESRSRYQRPQILSCVVLFQVRVRRRGSIPIKKEVRRVCRRVSFYI